MIPVLLYGLATLDAAFCGYRAAAGRNALIDKRAYYRRALWRGILAGQAAVLVAGAALALAQASGATWHELMRIGERMVAVYVPYALVLLAAFALRTLPSVDVRSLTSTLVFGPFTLLRPLVVVTGLVWGLAAAPRPALILVGTLVAFMMLTLEAMLGRAYRDSRP